MFKLFPIIFILIFSQYAFAKKKPKKVSLIDHIHSTLSGDILSAATRLDNFFGTERSDDLANDTRVRIYTVSTKLEGENPTTQGDLKIQLVLPQTQKKLRLIVESDDDKNEESTSSSTGTNTKTSTQKASTGQNAVDSTSAALRYIIETAGIRSSFDAGLRFTSKPQVFYRLRFRRRTKFGEWTFRPVEQIMWVQDEGHSSDTDLDFDKNLGKNWDLRLVNNIFWNDQDHTVNFTNGPSWFQTINEKIGLSYNLRAFSSNTPDFAINNYSASIGYRQLLYKQWFFWTIIPAVNFPRENHFHRTPSLTVRFDVILGSI